MALVHVFLNPVLSHCITPPPLRRLICKWQINTQFSEAVGSTPYQLAFGQAPKCGLSGLPIDASVLQVRMSLFLSLLLPMPPSHFSLPCVAESRHRGSAERGAGR